MLSRRVMSRIKAVIGYNKNGGIHIIHTSLKQANEYYARSANITRIDFYSVYPDQLIHLSMAYAMDIETKINSNKRRMEVGK